MTTNSPAQVKVTNHDLMMSLLPQPIKDFFLFEAIASFDPTPIFDVIDDLSVDEIVSRLRLKNRIETLKTYGRDHPCLKRIRNASRDTRISDASLC